MPTTLKVTIDISPIVYRRGVSLYTTNLIEALLNNDSVSVSTFGSSLRQRSLLQRFITTHQKLKHSTTLPFPPSIWPTLWYKLHWPPIETFTNKSDVFHAWEELIPPTSKTPVVATIHDLAMLRFPETAHPSTLAKHKAAWQQLKATNSHVIAVSQATKNDIIELLDFNPEKVHLVYEALPKEHQQDVSKADQQKIIQKLGIPSSYILFVGALEPRKNLTQLIKAWQPLQNECALVIAGANQWGVEFDHSVKNLFFLGRVGNKTLTTLYQNATIFAYPSLYEGFGLPILEAFSYGVPVLTSNNSAMSEISGNGAKLIDPNAVDSIHDGLVQLLNENNEKKAYRRNAMKLQLQLFNWDTTASKTIKVYQKAVADKS